MKLSERKRQRVAFRLLPLYRVTDLATMLGMSRFAMMRMIKRHGVETIGGGRGGVRMVTLVALRVGIPDLWESVLLAKALGHDDF